MASGLENIETIESPFRRFVTTIGVFPTAFTDAMTYYECLAYLVKYLEETVIPAVNENAEAVEELQTLYVQLKSYVDNYFDNLDVQEEINNKLDEMAESGQLSEIIASYLNSKAVFGFDNVASMKESTNLINGSYAETLGYYNKNDGGSALYKIRTITNDDVVDEASIISLSDDSLVAELVVKNNTVNVKQFGAYGDDTHDDTNAFKKIINYVNNKYLNLYINSGKYILTDELEINWTSENYFLSNFNRSYQIIGAGIYDSILKFNTNNGLLVNKNNAILALNIKNLSIINTNYDCTQQAGNERIPNDNNGIGLLLKHVGYVGLFENIAVSGFYIGIATRNCYGGPTINSCYTTNTIFGYSSKDDTGINITSSEFVGIESCYHQQGGKNVLTNCTAEGTFKYFYPTDVNNSRSKFEGRGFYNTGALTLISCHSEGLWGNALYCSGDFNVSSKESALNNSMGWQISQHSDLAEWLENNPSHNYHDFNMTCNFSCYSDIDAGLLTVTSTACINSQYTDNDGYADNIIFRNAVSYQGKVNTFNRFYKGNIKPIVTIGTNVYSPTKNAEHLPIAQYGNLNVTYSLTPTNYEPYDQHNILRAADFSNGNYNIGGLGISIAKDGNMFIYQKFFDKDTGTETKQKVISISPSGVVTFPQNGS